METEIMRAPSGELAQQQPVNFLGQLLAAAQTADVATARELLGMAKEIQALEAEKAFNVSMRAAQAEIKPVVRDAENSHTRSRYALLETIDTRIRPIYTGRGFSLSFNSGAPRGEGTVRILCDVRHDAGHTKTYELEGGLDMAGARGASNKTTIQALGSSVSYLRRYLTCMIFNVTLANEDNDGAGNRSLPTFITQEQADDVASMLSEVGLTRDDAGFLAWAGVDRIEHIMPNGLPRITRELEKRRAAR
jgi:hypothetical protein